VLVRTCGYVWCNEKAIVVPTDTSQDHVGFTPAFAVDVITHSQLTDPVFAARQTEEYVQNQTGMLTNCGGDILGKIYIIKTSADKNNKLISLGFGKLPVGSLSQSTILQLDEFATDWPHYEHLFLDGYFGFAIDSGDTTTDGRNYISSSASLQLSFSRGNVTISSNDTSDNPIISPNWLTDPRDQEMAVAAFKQARAVFTSNPGTSEIVLGTEVFPGVNISSDAQILDFIQRSATASYHGSCTCAMGKKDDKMAVLDSQARVYGVQGLRVVDASSFPVLPPGHPSATICTFVYRYLLKLTA
jgi:choline dehydrogenase-like flavoprotein